MQNTGGGILSGGQVYEGGAVTGSAQGEWVQVTAQDEGGQVDWIIQVRPPNGQAWVPGTTYSTGPPNSGALSINILYPGAGKSCDADGTVEVYEVERIGQNVSAFAAIIRSACGLAIELRWNAQVGYGALVNDPEELNFGSVGPGQTVPPRTVTVTARGSEPVTLGAAKLAGSHPESYSITEDTCRATTLNYGDSCTVTVYSHVAYLGADQAGLSIPADTGAGSIFVKLSTFASGFPYPPTPPAVPVNWNNTGTYYPVTPARILDTRTGNGAPKARLGPHGTLSLQVAGRGGVPQWGVAAVVLNVTATNVSSHSFLTVFPSAGVRPTASSLNMTPGWTGANSVTVGLSGLGQVDIFNNAGTTDVIVDVMGFYASDNSMVLRMSIGGTYTPVVPLRLFDSRFDDGWHTKVPGGYAVQFGASFDNIDPTVDEHIKAFVVNVTVVDPDGAGYLTAWTGLGSPPPTSTLNYTRGSTVPNMAVVPTTFYAPGGFPIIGVSTVVNAHVVVDLLGVFTDGWLGDTLLPLRFSPNTPTRIADSRTALGLPGPIGPSRSVKITTPLAGVDTWGLALNVTAVQPTANTFITVWPTGEAMPTASNLNPYPGQIVPNSVYTLIGPTNEFSVYNNAGVTGLVVDVVGTFYLGTDATAGTALAAKGTGRHPPDVRGEPTSSFLSRAG